MGFYHPATLVKDAQRHGVEVRPIDVGRSGWRCRWEGDRKGACRLGLRFVRSLRREAGEAIEREQALRPFRSMEDLARRCALRREELDTLAEIGATGSVGSRTSDSGTSSPGTPGLSRRDALWQAARAARPPGEMFAGSPPPSDPSPLPEMSPFDETLADYSGTGITCGVHPMVHFRPALANQGVLPAAGLDRGAHGQRVRTAGSVIVRQRPGTAKGLLFLTLEDETGMSQAIVTPDLLQENREVIVGAPGLVVEGTLQKRDGTLSVKAERFWRLTDVARTPSHDFR